MEGNACKANRCMRVNSSAKEKTIAVTVFPLYLDSQSLIILAFMQLVPLIYACLSFINVMNRSKLVE